MVYDIGVYEVTFDSKKCKRTTFDSNGGQRVDRKFEPTAKLQEVYESRFWEKPGMFLSRDRKRQGFFVKERWSQKSSCK